MSKEILLITENDQGFLVRALIKSLTDGGYNITISTPSVEEISYIKSQNMLPDIFIVYLEDYEDKYETLFPYLEKLLSRDGKQRQLYLVGAKSEFNAVYKHISPIWVSYAFERPVNSTEIIKQIQLVSAGYSYNDMETAAEEANPRKSVTVDPNRHRILLVDDDTTYLKSLERWFSKYYNVYTANSGMTTVSILKKNKVDLILLDYEMPVLSGLEVFQMLKSEPTTASIPVIFLTSKDDKETVMEVLSAKPANYLLKTKPPAVLLQNVEDFFKSIDPKAHTAQKVNSRITVISATK